MNIEIGKPYRIVGEVASEHGDCQGDIIVATDIGCAAVWFDGFLWTNFPYRGNYILFTPNDDDGSHEDYFEWLGTVIEEVK